MEDNSKIIFSYFSTKTYVVSPHQNRLSETVLNDGSQHMFERNYIENHP